MGVQTKDKEAGKEGSNTFGVSFALLLNEEFLNIKKKEEEPIYYYYFLNWKLPEHDLRMVSCEDNSECL